jgi:hypothetical protein
LLFENSSGGKWKKFGKKGKKDLLGLNLPTGGINDDEINFLIK